MVDFLANHKNFQSDTDHKLMFNVLKSYSGMIIKILKLQNRPRKLKIICHPKVVAH